MTDLPLIEVHELWKVPVQYGPITSMIVYNGEVYVSCAREVLWLKIDPVSGQAEGIPMHNIPETDND